MTDKFTSENWVDNDGNPAGGYISGTGLDIRWQNGPLGRGEDRQEPNGAFVETVIAAAADRIRFYQDSKYNCIENSLALAKLKEALYWLNSRTQRREAEETEGLHKGN